jgi:anti-anti-sigma factor
MKMIEGTMNGVPLIAIDGDLDRSSIGAVRDVVNGVLGGPYPPQRLLFDLTDCTFVDSGGLSVLFLALDLLPTHGWLGLIGSSAGATRVLTYTGFLEHDRVRFYSSPSDAAASLARDEKLSTTNNDGRQQRQDAGRTS